MLLWCISVILLGGAVPVESQWQIDCSSLLAVIITRWDSKKVGIGYSSNHLVVHGKQILLWCSFHIATLKCLNICSVRQELVLQRVNGHFGTTTTRRRISTRNNTNADSIFLLQGRSHLFLCWWRFPTPWKKSISRGILMTNQNSSFWHWWSIAHNVAPCSSVENCHR